MNESKRQSMFMIGIVLLVIAAVLFYIAWTQPRVYVKTGAENSYENSYQYEVEVQNTELSDETVAATNSSSADVSYPVNLNTATYDELISIAGIGDVKARQILQYRDAIGTYTSVEQIMNISGIGESTYNQVATYLTV